MTRFSQLSFKSAFFTTFALSLFITSCDAPDPEPEPYESGVVVLNAGNFFDNNGTLSFIQNRSTTVSTDIFQATNSRRLAGSMQGYNEIDGKGVILVDNSTAGQDKAEIVEIGTFKSLGTLAAPDIENPRQVVRVSANKAYITCWGATGDFSNFYPNPGYIAVVDMASRQVVKKIPVSKGAENMVVSGSEVLVGSVGGEKALTVIDLNTDTVKSKVELGNNPDPIGLDATGQLWVYSAKEMIQMNAQTKAVGSRLKINTTADRNVGNITFGRDRQNIFFGLFSYAADGTVKGETYSFTIRDASISLATPFIRRHFSGMAVDPTDGTIYAGVTPSYKQAGYVVRYQPNDRSVKDSIRVEIAPSGFFFK
ncbi:MAG: DUF5074 domain-containing protein [Cytophagales bacterium]|nr:MAG: DUF5074 domain-containing protein [Cytophagales bacterium]